MWVFILHFLWLYSCIIFIFIFIFIIIIMPCLKYYVFVNRHFIDDACRTCLNKKLDQPPYIIYLFIIIIIIIINIIIYGHCTTKCITQQAVTEAAILQYLREST